MTLAACAAPAAQINPTRSANQWRLATRSMAAAADRRAVEAALGLMKQGGSTVDAAIAAHTVLGLVEPQSSGLGGGGYLGDPAGGRGIHRFRTPGQLTL